MRRLWILFAVAIVVSPPVLSATTVEDRVVVNGVTLTAGLSKEEVKTRLSAAAVKFLDAPGTPAVTGMDHLYVESGSTLRFKDGHLAGYSEPVAGGDSPELANFVRKLIESLSNLHKQCSTGYPHSFGLLDSGVLFVCGDAAPTSVSILEFPKVGVSLQVSHDLAVPVQTEPQRATSDNPPPASGGNFPSVGMWNPSTPPAAAPQPRTAVKPVHLPDVTIIPDNHPIGCKGELDVSESSIEWIETRDCWAAPEFAAEISAIQVVEYDDWGTRIMVLVKTGGEVTTLSMLHGSALRLLRALKLRRSDLDQVCTTVSGFGDHKQRTERSCDSM